MAKATPPRINTNALSFCEKWYESEHVLDRHFHVVHKKKNYREPGECSFCEKSFRNLDDHVKNVHEEGETKKEKCQLCDKEVVAVAEWKAN